MKVYKVVRETIPGDYYSCFVLDENVELVYVIGRRTKPRPEFGPIFAFKDQEDAEQFIEVEGTGHVFQILVCSGRKTGSKVVSKLRVILSRSESLNLTAFKSFWENMRASNDWIVSSGRGLPPGTILCSSVVPLKVVGED